MEKPSLDTAKAGAMRFNTVSSQMEIYDGNQWTGILAELTPSLQTGGTRGIFGGESDTIDFVNIASTGDAIDFGNLTQAMFICKAASSRVRGFFAGDRPHTGNIDFITISSQGNAQDFGDLTQIRMELAGASSPTRGLFMGGANPGVVSRSNVVDFVTIATAGNAQDFGDFTANTYKGGAAVSNNTRAIHAGGNEPSFVTDIEFFTIATTGNGTDFGDLTDARGYQASLSNSVR